jgi:hypothetical protein
LPSPRDQALLHEINPGDLIMAKKVAKSAPAADVEVVVKPGLGLDEGIVLTTFLMLGIAIALVMMANKTYGA